MRMTLHEVSRQLSREVDALSLAAKRLDGLAKYCASAKPQGAIFPGADEWITLRREYLASRQACEQEHAKLMACYEILATRL